MSDIACFDRDRRERERLREFRLIFLAGYPLFLAAAVVGRVTRGAGAERGRSVFAEARATAYRTIPYAF